MDVVTLVVARRNIPKRRPRADVVPADIQRQHGGGDGFFHDGIVDGYVRRRRKAGFVETKEAQIVGGFRQRRACGLEDRRFKPGDFFQIGAGVENENSAVPIVAAGRKILLSRCLVGLFVEALDRIGAAVETFERRALFDVAVTGMRLIRLDAEQHELAGRSNFGGALHAFHELDVVLDNVVGRHDGQNRARVFP